MAKFEKGNTEGRKISGEIAADMQARSVEARRANTTLREALLEALSEPAAPGMTRLEALARKALKNHYEGKLTFKDLKYLSSILGEDTINVKTDGSPLQIVVGSAEAAEGLRHALQTGAQPGKPANEQ